MTLLADIGESLRGELFISNTERLYCLLQQLFLKFSTHSVPILNDVLQQYAAMKKINN